MKKDNSNIWIIIFICVAVFLVFVYPKYFKRIVNYTIPAEQTPIDLNDPTNNFTEEELNYYANRLTFEANYYANADGSGIELQELDLDYFTDASLTHQYAKSTGMQYLGDYKSELRDFLGAEQTPVDDFYYYDTTASEGDVITWSGGQVATTLTRSKSLIVKIDNKPYLLQMTGSERNYWWDILNAFTLYYNYGDLFEDIMHAVKTNSKGYGDYSIVVDLSNYFSIWKYDEASNQFLKEKNYAKDVIVESVVNFHYYERGATKASDSLFGQIALDNDYNTVKNTISFNTNGGVGQVASITAKQGSTVIVPDPQYEIEPGSNSVIHREGYAFVGWNTAQDGSGIDYAPGDEFVLNEDTTLYAQWSENVFLTLNFNYAGTNNNVSEFISGNTANLLAITSGEPTRTGYTFAGWNTAQDGSGTDYAYNSQIVMDNDLTLYAQWELEEYQIEFISSLSAESMAPQTFTNGVAQALTLNAYTQQNSTFLGWEMDLKDFSGALVNRLLSNGETITLTRLSEEERPFSQADFKVEIGSELYYVHGYGDGNNTIHLIASWQLLPTHVGSYTFTGGSFVIGENGLESFTYSPSAISITASDFDQRSLTTDSTYFGLWGFFGANNEYMLEITYSYDPDNQSHPRLVYLRQGANTTIINCFDVQKN